MNTKMFVALVLVLAIIAAGCPKNKTTTSAPVGGNVTTPGPETKPPQAASAPYSHGPRGLEKQFEAFLAANSRRELSERDEEVAVFALPDPGNWFGQYFSKGQVEQLGWDYQAEVGGYQKRLLELKPKLQFHATCRRINEPVTGLQPRADAATPDKAPPVEQYEIEFLGIGGANFSELSNFVYVDGAFRYVGKGAYPFWSMPDATRQEKH